ncbi:DNA replication/repair protein RecF [Croceicoccus sp. F390]|uniref:DNA replication and repair protein RecF n=1 Tax=Croceicoccus esteveae TaxID=3075597 RepID=A0ABU2ZF49_9SPHN|nr:DNA replication/repair protein RecF [Croceicoccus sp. F390]MDT0574836.1 DNA replication/repair protein RecF [Croceicoccus sp. F390]
MVLDRIQLANFRNHAASRLDGTGRFNLLVGENGAGKTNVLEALSLFAPGRGMRRAELAELSRQDPLGDLVHQGFAIGADLASGQTPVRLGTMIDAQRPGRRIVRASGAPLPASRLAEWVSVSWLTPAMDRLFAEGPGARRRFTDRLVLALRPEHASNATRYDRAMRERNRLLTAEHRPDPVWLEAIEREMAIAGCALMEGRQDTMALLNAALSQLPDAPFARPDLAIRTSGRADCGNYDRENGRAGSAAAAEALAKVFADSRARDRAAGRTLAGPHRDDLYVTMSASGRAAAECSTGEQKAMLIAIILAHAQLAAGARPLVLLLDEIAAHIDPARREALFDRLHGTGAQIWMTGTEPEPFAAILPAASVWQVKAGSVERVR